MEKKDVFQEQKFLKEYYDLLKESYIGLAEKILSYRKENKIKPLGDKLAYAQALAIFSILNPKIDLQKTNLDYFGFLTDGSDDCSFDLININEDKNIVEIFDFKRGDDGFSLNDLRILDGNIEDYIFNRKTYEELNNTLLKIQLEKIKSLVDKNIDTKIIIYLFREKNSIPDTTFLKKIESMKSKYEGLEIILMNKNDILSLVNNNLYNNLSEKKDDISIQIKVSNKIVKNNIIIGIISLFDLIQFIQSAKEKGIKDLYKLNVRKDLKNPELISNIKRTIIKTPENFLYFHNGITIVVKNINISGYDINLVEPQIINGCQSTSAIYNNFIQIINENKKLRENKFDSLDIGTIDDFEGLDLATYINDNYKQVEALKKANIQIKILSVLNNEELLIEKISEYSNKQISIEGYELRSNDLFNKIIEKYVYKYGFYYNRKKTNTNTKNDKKEITIKIDDLYQILYSVFSKDPQGAKNVKKKIFQLNNNENTYLDLLEKVNLKLILKIFIINKSFYNLNMDEAWRYYYILAFILIEEKEKFNILDKDFDYILKKGKEISDFILKIKSTDYYKKKDIFRNYGNEIWKKINNYINGENKDLIIKNNNIKFDKDIFIDNLRKLGGKGALILSIKGSFIKINNNVLNIKFKTQFAYNIVNTIENKNILKKCLKEMGLEYFEINLIK